MSAGVHDSLLEALETTPRLPRDVVSTTLALRYAERLDDLLDLGMGDAAAEDGAERARITREVAQVGARLEAMIDRLGLAPSARPIIPNGGPSGTSPEADQLDALARDAAAGAPSSGIDYAAGVDPAVAEADAAD